MHGHPLASDDGYWLWECEWCGTICAGGSCHCRMPDHSSPCTQAEHWHYGAHNWRESYALGDAHVCRTRR